jgi:hypothetical protein
MLDIQHTRVCTLIYVHTYTYIRVTCIYITRITRYVYIRIKLYDNRVRTFFAAAKKIAAKKICLRFA